MDDIKLLGSIYPRIFTPPLRELSPASSKGFEFLHWCFENGLEILPYQQILAIHMLELLEDGTYRFLTLLIILARQQGKTTLAMLLTLFRLDTEPGILVLGTSHTLDQSIETFRLTWKLAETCPALEDKYYKPNWATGRQTWEWKNGSRYKISAAREKAVRSWAVSLLICDEMRTHESMDVWSAASKTTRSQRMGQRLALSNAGDDKSVALTSLRNTALSGKDESLGLFEWSAPDGCALDDRAGWVAATPLLGSRVSERSMLSDMYSDPPEIFRQEVLCQMQENTKTLVDSNLWASLADPSGNMEHLRKRVVAALDVSPDLQHVTLAVAAVDDNDRAVVELAGAWTSVADARKALPDLLSRIKPRRLGVAPGPAKAALGADVAKIRGLVVLTIEATATACGELVEHVISRRLQHRGDTLLTSHVLGATKIPSGDQFRFGRREGHCDAAYAAAVAIHLARRLPASSGLRVLTAADEAVDDSAELDATTDVDPAIETG